MKRATCKHELAAVECAICNDTAERLVTRKSGRYVPQRDDEKPKRERKQRFVAGRFYDF